MRELLVAALGWDGELDRALVAGCTRTPQADRTDVWGDLEVWSDVNRRRAFAALDEEDGG